MTLPLLRSIFASIFVFLLPISLTLGQTIVYVTQSGAGNQSGSSWGNALPGVQLRNRLSTASSGTQLWIAGGTYKASTLRYESFSLKNNVEVYGGFIGSESNLSQRPAFNSSNPSSTTMSGDLGVIGDRNDNAYNIFVNNGLNDTAVLDGVVISDGATAPFGGGMYNNGSGAGNQCSPTIRNCYFARNSAEWGGAVYNYCPDGGTSSPTFTNCIFIQNRAFYTHGGAMYNDASGGTSSPVITNCQFISNQAGDRGGALANTANHGVSNPIIAGCTFSQNTAAYGGAVSNLNSAWGSLNPTIRNCLFTSNVAANYGGAIYIRNEEGTAYPKLTNCTIEGNRVLLQSNYGAAIFNDNTTWPTTIRLYNCIARNNLGQAGNDVQGIWFFGPNMYDINYSNIQGGFIGAGNIDADPLLVDAANGNYRLQTGSPSINTGDPAIPIGDPGTIDLAGNPRIYGDRIDMGAYERQMFVGPVVTVQPGNWNNPFTWLYQQLPGAADAVLIRHPVTLPGSYTSFARQVQYDANGQVTFSEGAKLKLD